MKKAILLACLSSTISSGLIADESSDFEAFLGAGHYKFDDERNLDKATSLELGAELPMTEALSAEAWFTKFDADIENSSSELDGTRYTLGGLYHFSNKSLRPFMSLGLGHLVFEDSSDKKHDEAAAYLGLGLKKYFDNNIILRGEVLGLKSFDHELTDLGARIAVGYAFGRSTTKPVAMAEPAPAPKVVQQMPKSEPIAEPVQQEPVKKADVAPAPKAVAVVVPPKDSDNDGVIDSLDQCNGTDKAFKVDASGCPIMLTEAVSIKMNVKFPSNSSVISKDNYSEIQKVADFMKQFDETNVVVEGYSDDRGAAAYNKSLSQKRADAVRMTLINEFKLDAKRVSAMGYGEESPIADNNTAAGRSENRRVIAVVKSSIKKAATH
jgi:OOP family OmpA-OmpF porin